MLPMGITREERRDPDAMVDTSAAAVPESTEFDDMWVGNRETPQPAFKDDDEVWAGAPSNRTVKIEGEEVMEIDTLAVIRQEISNGSRGKRAPAKEDGAHSSRETSADSEDTATPQAPPPKPTAIDLEEADRLERLQIMLEELGIQGDQEASNKEGRVYVFRFPRILPELYATPPAGATGAAAPVKAEPDDEVVMMDSVAAGPTVDLTNDANDGETKEEGGGAPRPPRRQRAPRLQEQPVGLPGQPGGAQVGPGRAGLWRHEVRGGRATTAALPRDGRAPRGVRPEARPPGRQHRAHRGQCLQPGPHRRPVRLRPRLERGPGVGPRLGLGRG